MKKIFFNAFFLLSTFFYVSKYNSQSYIGMQQSNYAGIMGANIQPASIADSRFKFDMTLFSFNVDMFNNMYFFDAKRMRSITGSWWTGSFQDESWTSDTAFFNNNIKEVSNPNNRNRGLYLNSQTEILNFMFSFKKKHALGFSFKLRNMFNLAQLDPRIATLGFNGLNVQSLHNIQFKDKLLNLSQMTWAEYGVNYAQTVYDKEAHFVKVGGRLKLLQGFTSMYLHTDNLDIELLNKDTATILRGDISYGFNENVVNVANGFIGSNGNLDLLQILNKSSWGGGIDIGAVYEWRPDWKEYKYEMDGEKNRWRMDKNKYKIKVGLSFIDLGGIKFINSPESRNYTLNYDAKFSVNNPNNTIPFDIKKTFSNITSIADVSNRLDTSSLIINNGLKSKNYVMRLPSTMSIQFDYNIWKWFYVNVTGVVNLHNKKLSTAVRVPHQIAITPRFDYSWVGVSIPLSYNEFAGFKAGLGLRLGPVILGVGDIKPLFAFGKIRGAEVYAGLRLPILYTKPKDKDEDKISKKFDECPKIPGIWKFKGCPDTDNDGVKDSEDKCPKIAGIDKFKGCPDTDNDGIQDSEDECPELSGLLKFKGCPDTDKDGISDKNDACPNKAGLEQFKGCPDTDKDGVEDKLDNCIDLPGPKETNGCPDSDGDGVYDNEDKCINEKGTRENSGCPYNDIDKDGVKDKEDKCPDVAGPSEKNGCPYTDTDGDGVIDKEDNCINTPGPINNKGCPKIEKEVEEILQTAFENLEFYSGKSTIKEASKLSLNKLAEVLVKKVNWGLQIAGHTDSDGSAQSNLSLSKRRAEAVRNYLMKKGSITDQSRFKVLYFGESEPLVPNTTSENKQKNRRVEMTIIFK